MRWVLQLVETGTDNRARSVDVMEISRPNDLGDIANLGLTLPEAKQILARVQQAVVAAQANDRRSHNLANFEWRTLLRRDSMKAHYGEGFPAGQTAAGSPASGGGADGTARETGGIGGAGFVRAGPNCCGMPGSRVRTRSPDSPTPGPAKGPRGLKSQGSWRRGSAGRA